MELCVRTLLACLSLVVAQSASAGTETEGRAVRPLAGHAVLDLRVGGDTTQGHHPTICLAGFPLERLSIEACGTGSGVLHHDDAPDLAHFRARFTVLQAEGRSTDLALLAGAGFAEVQRTADEPGFRFGEPTEPDPVEAAGPEVSASVQGRYWFLPKAYAIADVNAGVAAVPGAPAVLGHGGPAVPFASVTLGLGF